MIRISLIIICCYLTYYYLIIKLSIHTFDIYQNINVNSINLPKNNDKGLLIIMNHINCIEKFEDIYNRPTKENYKYFVSDLLILLKSIGTNRILNQIYFPAYNKNLYRIKGFNNIYQRSTNILNEIANIINSFINKKVNIIYSYKSTETILECLNKKELVVIMYQNSRLLKYNKLNYILKNSNSTLLPIKIIKNKNDYIVKKYNHINELNIELFNEIKEFLF